MTGPVRYLLLHRSFVCRCGRVSRGPVGVDARPGCMSEWLGAASAICPGAAQDERDAAQDERGAAQVFVGASELGAEAEVAGVTQSGHYVGVVVEYGVDGCHPEGDVVIGEGFFEVGDALFGGYGATDVEGAWLAVAEEGLVGEFEASACGQHGVDHEEGAVGEVGGCDIFHVYLDVVACALFAVGCDEGRVGAVEGVEEAFVKGESCAQHGAYDDAVVVGGHHLDAEGCLHGFVRVAEGAAHFVGHGSCHAFHVAAEEGLVLLYLHVAQLCHV